MDDDERRDLLEAVARGEVAPDDAATRLAGGDGPHESEGQSTGGAADSADLTGVETVRVVGRGTVTRVVGDDSVAVVDVRGPHSLERDGDTVVVRVPPARGDDVRFAFAARGRRRGRHRDTRRSPAVVRVNPSLALRVDAAASSVDVRRVRGPLTVRLRSSVARLRDVEATLDADVASSVLRVRARLTDGASTLRCHNSRVRLGLDPRSDLRIAARSRSVLVKLPEGSHLDGSGALTLGSGQAALRIEGSSSLVHVRTSSGDWSDRREPVGRS